MEVKIFVSHRIDMDCDTIDNSVYVPVRCGAVYDDREDIQIIGDNTGENISEKRMTYCELTVMYWAWKNVQADYYGLCHYRRYLNFSNHKFNADVFGNVLDQGITEEAITQYKLMDDVIKDTVKDYDVITSCRVDVTKFPGELKTIRDHYAAAPDLHVEDIDIMLDVIKEKQRDYYKCAKEYINGPYGYFCLLFVMKKDLFNEFCEWLFPILEEVERRIDMSTYTVEGRRTPGHLAERLFGIFLTYHKQKNGIKVKELQPVIFLKPQRIRDSLPCKFTLKNKTVPVVLAANNVFAPMVSTTIQSIIEHANPQRNYDIVVLTRDITKTNQKLIIDQTERYPNVSVRFFDVSDIIVKYDLKVSDHISIETYYRFLIQDILPEYDKVLYLDCDLVCNRDVAELYDTDLGDMMIGAARDPDYIGQITLNSDLLNYAYKELKLKEPFNYFQAGVLLFNTARFREAYSMDDWLRFASKKYRYMDQDVLNRYCQGQVKYLNMQWNMLIDCDNYRVPYVIKNAPSEVSEEYFKARKNPYVVHFAGHQKPWNTLECDMFEEFWKYAKHTPFYERLFIALLTNQNAMPAVAAPQIGVKGALVIYFKKHTPKWLRPFARWVKKILKW